MKGRPVKRVVKPKRSMSALQGYRRVVTPYLKVRSLRDDKFERYSRRTWPQLYT